MAIFYLSSHIEINESEKRNAGSKAVIDIETMLLHMGANAVEVFFKDNKHGALAPFHNAVLYYYTLKNKCLNYGDVLIIQMPVEPHTIFLSFVINYFKKKGIKVIVIIHDVNHVRLDTTYFRKCRMKVEELSIYKQADALIVHNEEMEKLLLNQGISIRKMVKLELFDYLADLRLANQNCNSKDTGVVVAGNLSSDKSGYIYDLKGNTQFFLYGSNYGEAKKRNNVHYMGSYMPDELVNVINGSFGLVWDGNSTNTCDGNYGSYLKINNPHKTSLYLACGMPVIIWKQAALASFVIKNNVGITISDLDEIDSAIANMTKNEYKQMKENAIQVSIKIRKGYFFETAFAKCMELIED